MRKVNITATAERQCLDDSKLILTGVYMHKFSNIELIALTLLQDAANATLRSETLQETVCDAIIANGAV